jgi:PAXNEB protein
VIGGGLCLGSIAILYEDSFSHYYSHLQKSYLAEGIVNDHKLLIVDPDQYRERDNWLRFLPAVYRVKDTSKPQEEESKAVSDEGQLKVAWRYNTLLDGSTPAVMSAQTLVSPDGKLQYRFDNSREMGSAFANTPGHALKKEELTV